MNSSLNNLYCVLGTSRQSFHQRLNRMLRQQELTANLLPLIHQIRADHPTLSCRAMYYKLCPQGMGRDAFERLCREHGLTQNPRRWRPRTTDSSGVVRFPDLLSGRDLSGMDQAWSSDITYFEVGQRYYYITFAMDCFSRRILGYSVSERLSTEQTTLPALLMSLAERGGRVEEGLIFHSDGGGQYYDKAFLALTAAHKMANSMCEWAWENGKAERLNGIIKNNYLAFYDITSLADLERAVARAVRLYNEHRPHKSLGYCTPVFFERERVILSGQTKPKMTRSLDADFICEGISTPLQVGQTKPQTPSILSADIKI